jgi:hypothetical protein
VLAERATPTAEMILNFLEGILNNKLNEQYTNLWNTTWVFFGYGAVSLKQHSRIMRVSTRPINTIPLYVRFKIVQNTAHGLLETFQMKESLNKLSEAVELSRQLYPEYSI